MKSLPSIGIIGGAGPQAGSLLFNQIVSICQQTYNCHRDSDFPLIHLLSYPFSEMLQGKPDHERIKSEVSQAIDFLQTDYIAIACNTLHTFLDENSLPDNFIHLINETKSVFKERPLVLCSETSRNNCVHQRFFSCDYPSLELQKEVCRIIDTVLKIGPEKSLCSDIIEVIKKSDKKNKEVILGCTELSLIFHYYPIILDGYDIIDPSLVLASKLCSLIFEKH